MKLYRHSAVFTAPGIAKLRDTFDRLKLRYDHISHDLMRKNASRRSLDLKRLEREFLEFDMRQLEKIIAGARTLKHIDHPRRIILGTLVTYQQGDATFTVMLVDPLEADAEAGRISIRSPMGQALLNHRVNDVIILPTAHGIEKIVITKLE
jgi:transcription elongation GreA/GreB family factor